MKTHPNFLAGFEDGMEDGRRDRKNGFDYTDPGRFSSSPRSYERGFREGYARAYGYSGRNDPELPSRLF